MNIIKVFGASLFVFSSWFIGVMKSNSYIKRIEELKELTIILTRLETQISYTNINLPAAFKTVVNENEGIIYQIFIMVSELLLSGEGYTVTEAVEITLKMYSKQIYLTNEDLNILKTMSFAMGSFGKDDQIKHIELAVKMLEENRKRAEIEMTGKLKLWPSIGFLLSSIIVLVML